MKYLFRAILATALSLTLSGPIGAAEDSGDPAPGKSGFTQGQLVVAAPGMPDPRFAESVIYMVEHNSRGAFGLIVNRPFGSGPLHEFLMGLGLPAPEKSGDVLLHYGGPVDPGRLFVLHSSDWKSPHTVAARGPIAATAHPDVLEAIAGGHGPRHSLVILGYAGWGPQQLEHEMARGDWITAPADPDLVFDDDAETKWERASKTGGLAL